MKFVFILVLALGPWSFVHAAKSSKTNTLDRQSLLKKAPVPERRKYTNSPRSTPCQDFHHYVCAEVENKFKIPSNRDRWVFAFSDTHERLLYAKKQFFNKIHLYKPPNERAAQFKNVYLSCMNKANSSAEALKFAIEEKAALVKIASLEALAEYSQSRIELGRPGFVSFDTFANRENPLKNNLALFSGHTLLPERSYYENPEVLKDYKILLTDFFKSVKMDQPEQRAQWVIDFENDYIHVMPLPSEQRQRATQSREIKRADFLFKYPHLKMERFLNTVPPQVELVDLLPEGNTFMNKALSAMPLEQLKSVFALQALLPFVEDGYPAFYDRFFSFINVHLGGPKKKSDRQEECTQLVADSFGMELDYELISILFPDFPTERVIALSESVRKAIIEGLTKNKWLSKSTRKEAVKKIESAKLYLVKPQAEDDWNFMPVKEYSQKFKYSNRRIFQQTRFEKHFAELAEPRKPTRWNFPPLTVDAFYSPEDNKFVLPMGILQYPFFDEKASDAENLGAIGAVIGHELGHGIDDQGAQYDHSGKVRQWFSKSDLAEFKERGEKFVSQFNKIGHDGKLTLGENIGDHVGITFAYNAAFPEGSEAGGEEKKKFFIAYGRNWCSVSTPAKQLQLLKVDPHAAPMERINQQVIHIDGFYEAFKCEESDRMYIPPKERIRIW